MSDRVFYFALEWLNYWHGHPFQWAMTVCVVCMAGVCLLLREVV